MHLATLLLLCSRFGRNPAFYVCIFLERQTPFLPGGPPVNLTAISMPRNPQRSQQKQHLPQ